MQNHFGIQNLWMVKNLSLKFKRIPLAMRLLVLFFAFGAVLIFRFFTKVGRARFWTRTGFTGVTFLLVGTVTVSLAIGG